MVTHRAEEGWSRWTTRAAVTEEASASGAARRRAPSGARDARDYWFPVCFSNDLREEGRWWRLICLMCRGCCFEDERGRWGA